MSNEDIGPGIGLLGKAPPGAVAKTGPAAVKVASAISDRVVFIDSLPYADFLALIKCGDVMLDTLHFNGQNTNLEAFALGVPVITLPGRLQRERHTYGMYRAMGFMDLVASSATQYVELAMKVANDATYRRACSEQIKESSGVLYENRDFVRHIEDAFRRMLEA
jgi:predicted O-linked N-acetylglucosamine transferase (SPINDLY family)